MPRFNLFMNGLAMNENAKSHLSEDESPSAGSAIAKKATFTEIFVSFFRVGAVMFGGGYAMYPILEREMVVRRRWVSSDSMGDIFALSQVIPGLIGINSAMLVGQRLRGWRGSLAALMGMIMVPFVLILILANVFDAMIDNYWVGVFMKGLRPAIAGLLLGTALRLVKQNWRERWSVAVGIVVTVLALLLNLNPVLVIIASVVSGIAAQWFWALRKRKEVV